ALMNSAVTFFDGEFAPADWQLETVTSGGGGTVSVAQQTTGGDPGAFRQVTDNVGSGPDYSIIDGYHWRVGATYDPSTQGAISTIDYSEDAILFSGGGDGEGSGVAIKQAGVIYYAGYHVTPESTWTHHAYAGLTADDFAQGGNRPDFSSNGAPIQFGFIR